MFEKSDINNFCLTNKLTGEIMSKIFIVILYIYAALHFFAFGGRTAEVTYDSNGNVIQQVYDRKGNMIGGEEGESVHLLNYPKNTEVDEEV